MIARSVCELCGSGDPHYSRSATPASNDRSPGAPGQETGGTQAVLPNDAGTMSEFLSEALAGAKAPHSFCCGYGTTEVVPFHVSSNLQSFSAACKAPVFIGVLCGTTEVVPFRDGFKLTHCRLTLLVRLTRLQGRAHS